MDSADELMGLAWDQACMDLKSWLLVLAVETWASHLDSVTQRPHLWNGDHDNTHLPEALGGFSVMEDTCQMPMGAKRRAISFN